jgi:hypothetical protein
VPSAGVLAPVAPALLVALAACTGAASQPAAAAPRQRPVAPLPRTDSAMSQATLLLQELVGCKDAAEMRVCLEAGLPPRELLHVGFDQVSLAQCVDRVIAAFEGSRQRPGEARVRERVADAVDAYLAARHEAAVRQSAGKATCLPWVR